MSIETKITDTKMIEVGVPAMMNAQDGYFLAAATTIEHGQRDPYTVGVRLTVKKED